MRAKFAKLCPFVVEAINPDRSEDEADEKYQTERELCKAPPHQTSFYSCATQRMFVTSPES